MAEIGSKTVATSGSIEARIGIAFVDPELAVGAGVTGRTDAGISVDPVDAGAVVHAGTGRAILIVRLAVGPRES